jgi:hypothetical protein
VPAQKDRPKKQKERRAAFTPDDIVRAIEAVQQTGLTVYGVEISVDGSINIHTASPFKGSAASRRQIATEDELEPKKRQA